MLTLDDIDKLVRALEAFRSRNGHFPACRHRQWVDSYGSAGGHEVGKHCPADRPCDGSGAPCSTKCAKARAALDRLVVKPAARSTSEPWQQDALPAPFSESA